MRVVSVFLGAMICFGCSGGNQPSKTGAAGSSAAGSGGAGGLSSAAGAGGGGGSVDGTGTAGASGSAGGLAGAAGSTAGNGGKGGNGGSAQQDGGTDLALTDSAPPSDVARDAIGDGPSSARQVARPKGTPYAGNGYYEYLPPGYGDGTKRPLLVFFHGIGENGDGSAAQLPRILAHGPPKLIGKNLWTADRPFVVLSSQHAGNDCPSATEVHDFITFAMGRYDVDPKKIFLTGLSCGGRAGWAYLGQFKGEQVLAAALIAADSTAAYAAAGCALLKQVAIWSFHGSADSPAADMMGMTSFMACPQPRKDAKFTLEQGADHQRSWERVYDDPVVLNDVLTWMLGQTSTLP